MASLMAKVVGKRLKRALKNVKEDNWDLSLLKGEGEFRDVELDELYVTEKLGISRSSIEKATCGRVVIKVPWKKLTQAPIEIIAEDVVITLSEEPELIDYSKLNLQKKQRKGKPSLIDAIVDAVSFQALRVTITTKVFSRKGSPRGPLSELPYVACTFKCASLESFVTTSDWEMLNSIENCWVQGQEKSTFFRFRIVKCTGVEVLLSEVPHRLIGPANVEIRLTTKLKASSDSSVTKTVIDIPKLDSDCTLEEFTNLMSFFASLDACLERSLLKPPPSDLNGSVHTNDYSSSSTSQEAISATPSLAPSLTTSAANGLSHSLTSRQSSHASTSTSNSSSKSRWSKLSSRFRPNRSSNRATAEPITVAGPNTTTSQAGTSSLSPSLSSSQVTSSVVDEELSGLIVKNLDTGVTLPMAQLEQLGLSPQEIEEISVSESAADIHTLAKFFSERQSGFCLMSDEFAHSTLVVRISNINQKVWSDCRHCVEIMLEDVNVTRTANVNPLRTSKPSSQAYHRAYFVQENNIQISVRDIGVFATTDGVRDELPVFFSKSQEKPCAKIGYVKRGPKYLVDFPLFSSDFPRREFDCKFLSLFLVLRPDVVEAFLNATSASATVGDKAAPEQQEEETEEWEEDFVKFNVDVLESCLSIMSPTNERVHISARKAIFATDDILARPHAFKSSRFFESAGFDHDHHSHSRQVYINDLTLSVTNESMVEIEILEPVSLRFDLSTSKAPVKSVVATLQVAAFSSFVTSRQCRSMFNVLSPYHNMIHDWLEVHEDSGASSTHAGVAKKGRVSFFGRLDSGKVTLAHDDGRGFAEISVESNLVSFSMLEDGLSELRLELAHMGILELDRAEDAVFGAVVAPSKWLFTDAPERTRPPTSSLASMSDPRFGPQLQLSVAFQSNNARKEVEANVKVTRVCVSVIQSMIDHMRVFSSSAKKRTGTLKADHFVKALQNIDPKVHIQIENCEFLALNSPSANDCFVLGLEKLEVRLGHKVDSKEQHEHDCRINVKGVRVTSLVLVDSRLEREPCILPFDASFRLQYVLSDDVFSFRPTRSRSSPEVSVPSTSHVATKRPISQKLHRSKSAISKRLFSVRPQKVSLRLNLPSIEACVSRNQFALLSNTVETYLKRNKISTSHHRDHLAANGPPVSPISPIRHLGQGHDVDSPSSMFRVIDLQEHLPTPQFEVEVNLAHAELHLRQKQNTPPFLRLELSRFHVAAEHHEAYSRIVASVNCIAIQDMSQTRHSRYCWLLEQTQRKAKRWHSEKGTRHEDGDMIIVKVDTLQDNCPHIRCQFDIAPVRVVYSKHAIAELYTFSEILAHQDNIQHKYQDIKKGLKPVFLRPSTPPPSMDPPSSPEVADSGVGVAPPSHHASHHGHNKSWTTIHFKFVVEKLDALFLDGNDNNSFLSLLRLSCGQVFLSNDNAAKDHPEVNQTDIFVGDCGLIFETRNSRTNDLLQQAPVVTPVSWQLTLSTSTEKDTLKRHTSVAVQTDSLTMTVSLKRLQMLSKIVEAQLELQSQRDGATPPRDSGESVSVSTFSIVVDVKAVDVTVSSDYVNGIDLFFMHMKDNVVRIVGGKGETEVVVDSLFEVAVNNINFLLPDPFIEQTHINIRGSSTTTTDEMGMEDEDKWTFKMTTLNPVNMRVTAELVKQLVDINTLLSKRESDALNLAQNSPKALGGESDIFFQYTLDNQTDSIIQVRQSQSKELWTMEPNKSTRSFTFGNPFLPKLLDIFLQDGSKTQDGISLDLPGAQLVALLVEDGSTSISRLESDHSESDSDPNLSRGSDMFITAPPSPSSRRGRKRWSSMISDVSPSTSHIREMIVDVTFDGFRRHVKFLSSHLLVNTTSKTLEFQFEPSFKSPGKVDCRCGPGERFPVSNFRTWGSSVHFRLRPHEEFQWSEPIPVPGRGDNRAVEIHLENAHAQVNECLYMSSSEQANSSIHVFFSHPLVLHNTCFFPLQFYFPSLNYGGLIQPESSKSLEMKASEAGFMSLKLVSSRKWSVGVDVASTDVSTIPMDDRATRVPEEEKGLCEDPTAHWPSRTRLGVSIKPRLGMVMARDVYIAPENIILNRTDFTFFVKQRGQRDSFVVRPLDQVPFSWRTVGRHQLTISVPNGSWSHWFDIYNASKQKMKIKLSHTGMSFIVALTVSVPENVPYARVVEFSPTLLCHNKTTHALRVRIGIHSQLLSPGETLNSSLSVASISLALPTSEEAVGSEIWEAVPLSLEESSSARLVSHESGKAVSIDATVKETDMIRHVELCDNFHPPYILENNSTQAIEVRQAGSSIKPMTIEAGASLDFFWVSLQHQRQLQIRFAPCSEGAEPILYQARESYGEFSFPTGSEHELADQSMFSGDWSDAFYIDSLSSFVVKRGGCGRDPLEAFSVQVRRHGPTKLVAFYASEEKDGSQAAVKIASTKLLTIAIPELILQFHDHNSFPVLHSTLVNVNATLGVKSPELIQFFHLKLEDAQVDNLRENAEFPVLLAFDRETMRKHPIKTNAVELFVERSAHPSFQFTRYIGLRLLPLIIKVDAETIQLSNEFSRLGSVSKDEEPDVDDSSSEIGPRARFHENVFIGQLTIFPVDLILCVGENEQNFAQIHEGVRIQIPKFDVTDLYLPPSLMTSTVVTAYSERFRKEFYRILGSTDMLLNPLAITSRMRHGIRDFFTEPWIGLVLDDTPGAFLGGVWYGGKSLLKNLSITCLMVMWSLTNGMSSQISRLTLDQTYQRRRWRRRRPDGVVMGVVLAVISIFSGAWHGIQGFWTQLVEAYNEEESYLSRGQRMAKSGALAVVGVPLKVLTGTTDGFAHLLEGSRNSIDTRFAGKKPIMSHKVIAGQTELPEWFFRNIAEYKDARRCGFHRFPVKMFTKRKRVRDRVLVLTDAYVHIFNPAHLMIPGYRCAKFSLSLILKLLMPVAPESVFECRLRKTFKGKESLIFVAADRLEIITALQHLYAGISHQMLQVQQVTNVRYLQRGASGARS